MSRSSKITWHFVNGDSSVSNQNTSNLAIQNNNRWAEPELNRRPLACKGAHSDVNWVEFKEWLSRKYAKSHYPSILSYCKRYNHIIWGDMRDIEKISPKSKNHAVKALIVLSKYLGIHEEFKTSLKNYGVKLYSPDAFSAFMRVYTNQNSNLKDWLKQASEVLRPNEQLYLEFMSLTGLRKEEGIISFNKIIELNKQDNLKEYYNEEKGLLEHFKYKEQFLRRTKTSTSPLFLKI